MQHRNPARAASPISMGITSFGHAHDLGERGDRSFFPRRGYLLWQRNCESRNGFLLQFLRVVKQVAEQIAGLSCFHRLPIIMGLWSSNSDASCKVARLAADTMRCCGMARHATSSPGKKKQLVELQPYPAPVYDASSSAAISDCGIFHSLETSPANKRLLGCGPWCSRTCFECFHRAVSFPLGSPLHLYYVSHLRLYCDPVGR